MLNLFTVSIPSEHDSPRSYCMLSLANALVYFVLSRPVRFEIKSKDPRFRIETPSRIIHSLRTPVSLEISDMHRALIRQNIVLQVKKSGISAPPTVRQPSTKLHTHVFSSDLFSGIVSDSQTANFTLVSASKSGSLPQPLANARAPQVLPRSSRDRSSTATVGTLRFAGVVTRRQ
jgi:hypothetical protein